MKTTPKDINNAATPACPLTPLHDKIIVTIPKGASKTKGGLHLPEGWVDNDNQSRLATIVAIGDGVLPTGDNKRVEFSVKVGDQVFLNNTGICRLIEVDDTKFFVIKEYDILALAHRPSHNPTEPADPE